MKRYQRAVSYDDSDDVPELSSLMVDALLQALKVSSVLQSIWSGTRHRKDAKKCDVNAKPWDLVHLAVVSCSN